MTNFDAMYNRLFKGVTEAILALQLAQREAEDIYIETCDLESEAEPVEANCIRPQSIEQPK